METMDTVDRTVNQVIMEILKVSEDKAVSDLTIYQVDSWDSITHMDLILTIEDKFGIEFSGDDIADMISFEAIRKAVKVYIGRIHGA